MSFIGIVTSSKKEENIIKKQSNIFPGNNTIIITDKNIKNIKNIKFEILILNNKIKGNELKHIVSKAKYIILNTDVEFEESFFKDLNLIIISYGFNNKATFTISSVSENNIIICLQRTINNINNEKIEPQEYVEMFQKNDDINVIMYKKIVQLIYSRS